MRVCYDVTIIGPPPRRRVLSPSHLASPFLIMKTTPSRFFIAALSVALASTSIVTSALSAQTAPDISKKKFKEPLVEFGMMTWPEVREAFKAGKTTALVYTG